MFVPDSGEPLRRSSASRPAQPPFGGHPNAATSSTQSLMIPSSEAPCKQTWLARNQRRVGLVLGATALILIGWSWVGLGPRADVADPGVASKDSLALGPLDQTALTYFGIPLRGQDICYVVDGDESMGEFIDKIMLHAIATNASIKPGVCRMGVIQAIGIDDQTQLEITPLSSNLRLAAAKIKTKRPQGETDLALAMRAAAGWNVDQIVLVLAKGATPSEIEALRQEAIRTGAVVDVIAFGEASNLDLSALTEASGGRVARISNEELQRVIDEDRTIATSLQKWR